MRNKLIDFPRFAVIGAGNCGQAMDAHLTSLGFEVNLYNRSKGRIDAIKKRGGIKVKGAMKDSWMPSKVTTNIKDEKPVPVILFGDFLSAYGAIRGLSQYNVPIYIVTKTGKGLAICSRFVKKYFYLNPNDEQFIKKLNIWFKNEIDTKVVLMVAGDDYFLDALAKGYNDLSPSMKLTFPGWKEVVLVREKRRTYEIAENLGIPIPKTFYVSCWTEMEDLLKKEIKNIFPILMKSEADSSIFLEQYKTKGIICDNSEELLQNYDKYQDFHGGMLIQEFIPGDENNLFCLKTILNKNSDPLAVFVDRKIHSSKRLSACTLTRSTWSQQVVEYGLKLLKEIGYFGYASVEFKFDSRDGCFKLMEINGRVSMNNSNALKCGINLPYLLYKEALNGPLPPLKKYQQMYPNDIAWWYPIGDMRSIFNSIIDKTFNPIEYIKSLQLNKCIIEPLNLKDLTPFVYDIKQFLNSLCLLKSKIRIK